jgi:hypothetical protein
MRFTFGSAPLSPLASLEIVLTLLCIVVALVRPGFGANVFQSLESKLRSISARPRLCAVLLFALPIAARLLLLPVYGPPTPFIHDEYAYLLQADTFALGRLTNPRPPFADHFSSIYVLSEPTYTAEYQPAQAVTLAIGQLLTGHPWTGALVSIGVFFVALYWALRAWFSPSWALTATLIVEISIGVLGYWTNSYWGGSVPGIGGALVLGSLPRLRSSIRASHSYALAVGISILLYSRPLEGLLLSVLTAGALIYWLGKKELPGPTLLSEIMLPILIVSAPVVLFEGYYNGRVTGHSIQSPYLLYRAEFGLPQGFFWQRPVTPERPLPADIKSEYDTQLKAHERRTSLKGLAFATAGKLRSFWEFYIGVPLTLPLVFLPASWRTRNRGLAAFALLLILGFGNLTYFAYFPHYSAAIAVAIYVVLFDCFRKMRSRGPGGLFLSRAMPMICLLGLLIPMTGRFLQPLLGPDASRVSALWAGEFENWISREQFTPRLNAGPDRHLVFVRYDPRAHQNDDAWVYNRADLERAKIVWARELNPASNVQVMRRFAGRKVWLALPDQHPQRLIPYPDAGR